MELQNQELAAQVKETYQMVTRLETEANEEKEYELQQIRQRLDQILNEHRHCSVTRAKMGLGATNFSLASPRPPRQKSRRQSDISHESGNELQLGEAHGLKAVYPPQTLRKGSHQPVSGSARSPIKAAVPVKETPIKSKQSPVKNTPSKQNHLYFTKRATPKFSPPQPATQKGGIYSNTAGRKDSNSTMKSSLHSSVSSKCANVSLVTLITKGLSKAKSTATFGKHGQQSRPPLQGRSSKCKKLSHAASTLPLNLQPQFESMKTTGHHSPSRSRERNRSRATAGSARKSKQSVAGPRSAYSNSPNREPTSAASNDYMVFFPKRNSLPHAQLEDGAPAE